MSDYHHVYRPNAWYVAACRCGHQLGNGPPDDCPAAMREEIVALREQVEAEIVEWLRAQPCVAEGHDDRWCQACTQREDLADAIARRHMTRAATDIENGAHRV